MTTKLYPEEKLYRFRKENISEKKHSIRRKTYKVGKKNTNVRKTHVYFALQKSLID